MTVVNRREIKKHSKNLEDLLSIIKVKNDGLSIYFGLMDNQDAAIYRDAVSDAFSCEHKLVYLYNLLAQKGKSNDKVG